MAEWLQLLGHSESDIDALNVIHVAGTKGKGSTCAFTESFLRAHGRRTGFPRKTGLYTSPHLIVPEERIRFDSVPIAQDTFAKYVFEVCDRLPQLGQEYDPTKTITERGPRSLQLYALVAFHAFISECVDVVILETHSGGEYDATNVVSRPIVTAVTSLGMDHVQMLGPTIENIAWHKAGIFKQDAVALSTTQDASPAGVLVERAKRKGQTLRFIDVDSALPCGTVQLRPYVQKQNASLARAAANALLASTRCSNPSQLSQDDVDQGIEQWHWPGRFQMIADEPRTWFVDAAHNEMSVRVAAEWFAESSIEADPSATQVLIFTHISEHRDAEALLESLIEALRSCNAHVSHVVFTSFKETEHTPDAVEEARRDLFRSIWQTAFPQTTMWSEPTIPGAIRCARFLSTEHPQRAMHILITGSQHLIGPALLHLPAT